MLLKGRIPSLKTSLLSSAADCCVLTAGDEEAMQGLAFGACDSEVGRFGGIPLYRTIGCLSRLSDSLLPVATPRPVLLFWCPYNKKMQLHLSEYPMWRMG